MQNLFFHTIAAVLCVTLAGCTEGSPFDFPPSRGNSRADAREQAYRPAPEPFFRGRLDRRPERRRDRQERRDIRSDDREALRRDNVDPEPPTRSTPEPRSTPGPTPTPRPTPRPTPATTGGGTSSGDVPYGVPVPGKPGYVTSPFSPDAGYVDVTGLAPGSKAQDPYSGKVFRVP